MKDIQNQPDTRRISIQKVGVKNITYPVTVLDKEKKTQKTVATLNMYVNLPHHFKGTHMSRFVEILNEFHGEINLLTVHLMLQEMKNKLQAEAAHMEVEFPYFLKKSFNDSGIEIREYSCRMHGSLHQDDELTLEVQVPISPPSVLQDSNSMPRSLGHWGTAHVSIRFRHFIWIEDLIDMVESAISAQNRTSPLENVEATGLSVENLTRLIGRGLQQNKDIRWFQVTVKNHADGCNTFATLEWPESF